MQNIFLYALKFVGTILSGVGAKKKLYILIYHRVLDEPDYMKPSEVDKKIFTWQMELLSRFFNVLPLNEALEKLENNRLPGRAVSITFDDGYADNYLNALPILNKLKLRATFFVANGFLNGGIMWNDKVIEGIRRTSHSEIDLTEFGLKKYDVSSEKQKKISAYEIISSIKHKEAGLRSKISNFIAATSDSLPTNLMMTNQQLCSLYNSGMEIGGHTVSHPILANLDDKHVKEELVENKKVLENLLNCKLTIFAYPNGKVGRDYKLQQVELVKNAGYKYALSTEWGVSSKKSDKFQLPRFTPWDRHPVKFMLRMLRNYITISKSYNSRF